MGITNPQHKSSANLLKSAEIVTTLHNSLHKPFFMKIYKVSFLLSLLCLFSVANAQANDGKYKFDFPSDTKASVIIIGQGNALYSRFGHSVLRIQTDSLQMDYIYSYESEDVSGRIMSFLRGDLLMGMFATPTRQFIERERKNGRFIHQYALNLPGDASNNLWKIIDGHAYQGAHLKYDYLKRGCAYSTFLYICQACKDYDFKVDSWPENFSRMTRRELAIAGLRDCYWTKCFLNLTVHAPIDNDCTNFEKVLTPEDMIEVLQHTTVGGKPILSESYEELSPQTISIDKSLISPLGVALIILALLATSIMAKGKYHSFDIMTYLLLTIQTLLGLFIAYLVFYSSLPCTEWSWLLVPFTPLALLLWKWRRKWCLAYAVIIFVWIIGIIVYPHMITDWTFVVLALALAVDYIYIYFQE